MKDHNNSELVSKARFILEYGVECAANAFETMIGSKALVENFELQFNFNSTPSEYLFKTDAKVILLKTELMGTIAGINYFMFTEHEMKAISQKCFSNDIEEGSAKENNYMLVEFMKEIENIVAASTIAVIANKFETHLYGDVPKIQAVYSQQVPLVIEQEVVNLFPELRMQSKINVPELGISPIYNWFFNHAFVDKLAHLDVSMIERKIYA